MRGLTLTLIYLFCAVTAASLLAWLLHGVIAFPYEKVLSRSVLLFCALGLLPLWRLGGLSAQGIGLLPADWRVLRPAFVTGVLLILPLMLFFVVVGYRVADDRVVVLAGSFLLLGVGILLSALLVGVFEELLFRGVLFSALRRTASFTVSAVWVGGIYAAVHFLGADSVMPEPQELHWYTGFIMVGAALGGFADPAAFWDSFIALALLGAMLCFVRERLGLWWCIGLHWAWVFAIRIFKELTVRDTVNPYAVTAGSYDQFVGHAATVWLLFILVVIVLFQRHRQALHCGSTASPTPGSARRLERPAPRPVHSPPDSG